MFLSPAAFSEKEVTIRRAESLADYRACQEAQRKAWGIAEDGYIIPIATMVGANLHGGLVLGAFLEDGSAAAMSFAFLGRLENRHLPLLPVDRCRTWLSVAGPWLRGQDGSALSCPH